MKRKRSGKNKNAKLLSILIFFVIGMIGLSYASVPLYRIFCNATACGGTTQRVAVSATSTETTADSAARPVESPKPIERWVTVTFDSNVDSKLPWDFGPDVKEVRIKLGQIANVTYHAHNRSTKTLVGMATFNVQPDKIGSYFDKIQCFCFTKQVLKPGQSVTLPVQFYVDPAMASDNQTDDVQNITLSYTFFLSKDQSKARTVTPDP
jgi:cytochrome c oxidase assembly protein subunit 11